MVTGTGDGPFLKADDVPGAGVFRVCVRRANGGLLLRFAQVFPSPDPMTLPQVLEALLFASPKPLTLGEMRAALRSAAEFTEEPLAAVLARSRDQDLLDALDTLSAGYREGGHAFELAETARRVAVEHRGGVRAVGAPAFPPRAARRG